MFLSIIWQKICHDANAGSMKGKAALFVAIAVKLSTIFEKKKNVQTNEVIFSLIKIDS